MHIMQVDDEYAVHHNGDFSGDVWIDHLHSEEMIEVPFYVLEYIVATSVVNNKIRNLEQASVQEILYGPT